MNGKRVATINIGHSGTRSAGGVSFGLTSAQREKLQAIGNDPDIRLWSDLRRTLESLFWVTRHVHDLVISGKKDEARDWCRFIENSSLLSVLSSPAIRKASRVSDADLLALQTALIGAQGSCHPEAVTSASTDIGTVRNHLAQIASDISEIKKTIFSACPVHTLAATNADSLPGGFLGSARQATFEFVKTCA